MAYAISQEEDQFIIKAANIQPSLDAANATLFPPGTPSNWKPYTSLEKLFEDDRWELKIDQATGDVIGIAFIGEKGSPDIEDDNESALWLVRQFVEAGSYIQMHNEVGTKWRWVFDGQTVQTRMGTTTY